MRSSINAAADSEQVSIDELELLTKVAGDLASAMALEPAWERFARSLAPLIDYDRLLLALYDPNRDVLRDELEFGLSVPGVPMNLEVPRHGSIGGAVISSREPVIDNFVGPATISRFPVSRPLLAAGIRSLIAFPLLSAGGTVGVLHFQSLQPRTYGRRDVAVGGAIASLAGGVFGSLNLIRRLESRVYDLSQSGAERQILTDIAAIVSSSLDISDAYVPFCERLGQLIPWDRIVIQTLTSDGQLLDRFSSGVGARQPNSVMSLDGTVAAEAIKCRRPLHLSANTEQELREIVRKYPTLERSAELGQRSGVVVPLIVGDEVLGVLQISSGQPDSYTDKHLQLAEQIALSLASSIRNSDMHEEMKRAAEERERLAARDAIASELERRSRERSAFLSQLSHELKTPLTSMGLFAELLARRSANQEDPKSCSYIDGILRNVRRMERLIGDLLDVSAMETGQFGLKLNTVNLAAVAGESAADFRPYASLHGQSIIVDAPDMDSVEVMADRERVAQVMSILLDNACKYAGDGATIALRVLPMKSGVRVEVEDDGPGLGEEEIERIFDRFYRGERRGDLVSGTGLGLHMARAIVEAHGGAIGVERGRSHGAGFYLEIPAINAAR